MENPPSNDENFNMRLVGHEGSLKLLDEERTKVLRHIEIWKLRRQVLEAIARKLVRAERRGATIEQPE